MLLKARVPIDNQKIQKQNLLFEKAQNELNSFL